jgi:anaerobic ribonucleoside-triphosphate reductase
MYDDPDYGDNVCQACGKSDDTVYERACGYSKEIGRASCRERV